MANAMKTLFLSLAASAFCLCTSCNTFIGIGRDLRLLGQSMESTATGSGKKDGGKQPENQGGAPVY